MYREVELNDVLKERYGVNINNCLPEPVASQVCACARRKNVVKEAHLPLKFCEDGIVVFLRKHFTARTCAVCAWYDMIV
jgi:hypothetical protein